VTVPEAASPATGVTDGWAAFDPLFLSPSTSPAPRFPIEALPENLRSLVIKFAEARLLCVDYVAASVLAACSGAIGNRVRLLTFEGDAEPLAMFTTLNWPAQRRQIARDRGCCREASDRYRSGVAESAPADASGRQSEISGEIRSEIA
jgi:hypothetical protein